MSNKKSKHDKEPRTAQMVDRLRLLQHQHEFSDSRVARRIGISLSKYKNIIRTPDKGGNLSVDKLIIERLANLYECTTDYILGFSSSPSTDKSHRKITQAINFDIRNKTIDELNNFLYDSDNFSTLQNLHFLIYSLPAPKRNDILKGFNTFMDILRKESFYGRIGSIPNDKLDMIMNINEDDPDYIDAVLALAKANSLYAKGKLSKALPSYVEVIYIALTKNAIMVGPLAETALRKINRIHETLDDFPYDFLESLLANASYIEDNRFFNVCPKVITDIKEYLNIEK